MGLTSYLLNTNGVDLPFNGNVNRVLIDDVDDDDHFKQMISELPN